MLDLNEWRENSIILKKLLILFLEIIFFFKKLKCAFRRSCKRHCSILKEWRGNSIFFRIRM